MLAFQTDFSLQRYNSFGFSAVAERFVAVEDIATLIPLVNHCQQQRLPLLLLGGGSNLVLSDWIPGVVAHMALKGVEVRRREGTRAWLRIAAGEPWHETLEYLLQQGFYGLENLALIPGTVGAAPVQNIGAYGLELKDRLTGVEVYDTQEQRMRTLSPEFCQFGYRESLFKSEAPGRYIITAIEVCLSTEPDVMKLEYQALRETCEALAQGDAITPQHLFAAVCQLRQSKLPDPRLIGNAGSFFKNPYVSSAEYQHLKAQYPSLIGYPEGDLVKLAAGWLIEACGWKGKSVRNVGVYEKQALVLVNHGGGNRAQIEELAAAIGQTVEQRFGVKLEAEPRFYP